MVQIYVVVVVVVVAVGSTACKILFPFTSLRRGGSGPEQRWLVKLCAQMDVLHLKGGGGSP